MRIDHWIDGAATPPANGRYFDRRDPVTGEVHEKPERAQWHSERQSRRGRKKREAAPQETDG